MFGAHFGARPNENAGKIGLNYEKLKGIKHETKTETTENDSA